MSGTSRVPAFVCLVAFGWVTSAGAAPKADPHSEVIPSDDASHACPALEAKLAKAKDDAEATHFENQLWAHGCRSCDDASAELVKAVFTDDSSVLAASSVSELKTVIEHSDAEHLFYQGQGYYDGALVSSEKLGYFALTAKVEYTEVRALISEVAENECSGEVQLTDDVSIHVIGCAEPYGGKPLLFDITCQTIEDSIGL